MHTGLATPLIDGADEPEAQLPPTLTDRIGELEARLIRMEKQIAFMSSNQAIAEKQMMVHVRATALDLAIKAASPGSDLTEIANLLLQWLMSDQAS